MGPPGPQRGKAPWGPLGPFWPLGPQYGLEGALLALDAMCKQRLRVTGKKELRVTGKWVSRFRVPEAQRGKAPWGPLGFFCALGPQYGLEGALPAFGAMGKHTPGQ